MGSVREIRIARRTGFCYGVREAIDKAKEASAAGKSTHTLGQVVHNEGVIAGLERLGIETVETLDDVDHGAAVVIRAHGVRPDVMERANARGLEVIDGTCTWVIQEHRELVKLVDEGYTIVLLGTPNHAEVVGMLGFAPDAIVVDEEDDWEQKVPRKKRLALISQSTQPPWKFEKLAAFMVGRSHELKIVNTVCPVTIRRQEDTVEAAQSVDLMVVVGGRSSANTKELTRLVGIAGKPAIQIENAADLTDPSIFDDRARTPRHRMYGDLEWNGRRFVIVDTGGLEVDTDAPIEIRVQEQARLAIREADVILFVVDAVSGMTPADQEAAELLRTAKAPVLVAVNKVDNTQREADAAEFWAMGWEEIYSISASHGRGTGDLLDAIVWALPPETEAEIAPEKREDDADEL